MTAFNNVFRHVYLSQSLSNVAFRGFCNVIKEINNVTPELDTKLLKVAIIGLPNSGKSTFINFLMDRKVCPVSEKVHTTKTMSMAVCNEGNTQIVFLDTPGIVSLQEHKKFNLDKSFLKDSKNSLHQADIIGVIHDVTDKWTRERLDLKIIRMLESAKSKSSFLVLNKVDILKSKRKLLDLARLLTENKIDGQTFCKDAPEESAPENQGWPYFKQIFMTSSLTGSGMDTLKKFLIRSANPGKWMFPEGIWSDQTAEEIIEASVRAKFLDFLPQELPYVVKAQLEYFDINEIGNLTAVVLVHCPTERKARLIAGTSDGRLRQINESVRQDLEYTFQTKVKINIVLQVSEKESCYN